MKELIILLFITIAIGGDTVVELYGGDLDNCIETISSIPYLYDYKEFEGLKEIRVYDLEFRKKDGEYFWNTGIINLYDGCNRETMIHELNHFKNNKKGITLFQEMEDGHNGKSL